MSTLLHAFIDAAATGKYGVMQIKAAFTDTSPIHLLYRIATTLLRRHSHIAATAFCYMMGYRALLD
jgi:hypothetical protein